MNIAVIRAFIVLKKLAIRHADVVILVKELKSRVEEHDVQLSQIYDTIENLLDKKILELVWKDRQRIGFKNSNEDVNTH